MGNYGASYFNKSDDDAANDWMRIAALSKQIGDEAEKTHTATAYEMLNRGESLPEDTRDSIKVNAKKMLKENIEGETIAAEQQIMADAQAKAKEQGIGIHDYLRSNVDSYMTTPANLRAVGSISKQMQERQVSDANYQKAKMEEGALRYKEVSAMLSTAEGLYGKGDMEGATKAIEAIAKIMPFPGTVKQNDDGKLEVFTTDIKNGGHKPTGKYLDVRGALDAAKSISRDEMMYGYGLNAETIKSMNAKNLLENTKFTDKDGRKYMGFNFIDPYDATDTRYMIKEVGTGRDVAKFASVDEAVKSGFMPYDQKYEEGEEKLKNTRLQRQFMIEDQGMQREGFGVDMMLKKLNIQDKKADMGFQDESRGHQRKRWDYEESLYPTKEEMEKEKLQKLSGRNDKDFYKGLFGTGNGSASDSSSEPMSYDDMKMYKTAADKYRGLVDDTLLVPLIKETAPRAKAAVETGTAKTTEEAFNNLVASKLNVSPVELSIITSPEARSMKPDELRSKIENIKRTAAMNIMSDMKTKEKESALGTAFSVDNGAVSNIMDTILPGIIYDKQGKIDEIIADMGMKLNIDKEQAMELYSQYAEQHQPKTTEQLVNEVRAKKEAKDQADFEEKVKRNRYLGKPTYGTLGKGNNSKGYLRAINEEARL